MVSPTNPGPHQPQPSNIASPSLSHHAGPPSTPVRVINEVSRRSTRKSDQSSYFWTLPGTQWDQLQIERQKRGRNRQSSASNKASTPAGDGCFSPGNTVRSLSCQRDVCVNTSSEQKTTKGIAKISQAKDLPVPSGPIERNSGQDITAQSSGSECLSNQARLAETSISPGHPGRIVSKEANVQSPCQATGDIAKARSLRVMARRPGRNQVDYVAELKESIHESLSKLSAIQEKLTPLGLQIIALEEELKAKEGNNNVTLDDTKRLDEFYRAKIKLTEQEISILHNPPDDLINKMGILNALAAREDNQAPSRGSGTAKPRGSKRSTVDSEPTSIDSPGPSPSDVRSSDQLRRVKGHGQRSSSVASQPARDSSSRLDDNSDSFRSGLAERSKLLNLHAEVAYKQSKATHDSDGERIHCTINGIRKDKASGRPLYDIKDKDESENLLYTAKFEDLLAIPPPGSQLPTFTPGKYVIALYPGTTTFYNAQVINLIAKRDVYSLKFEGEENEKEVKEVERRYVLDTKTK